MSDKAPQSNPDSKESSSQETNDSKKTVVSLEEDDEFEDFPAEDWKDSEADIAIPGGKQYLWEENWDGDDADDYFSHQLREELKKSVSQNGDLKMSSR
ncbi:DSS1/SEM1 family-domain-containing protein [Dipodascopsis uninucleata]